MEFRPIELSDKELIESYTFSAGISNCDLSFANIYCWQPTFHSAWAIVEGCLVIRFQIEGGERIGYMQPLSTSSCCKTADVIPHLAKDAYNNGQRLRIIGITQEGRERLNSAHPNSFAFYSDRDYEDYIYSREELTTLSGRRYQPKRNHINQFSKLYDYEYHTLRTEHFKGCLELCQQWQDAHSAAEGAVEAERGAIRRAFDNFDALKLYGGVITIDNRVVAFTYGSPITHSTFCTHIEKCDTSFTGIYSAINALFARSLPPQYTLINREEDMGIEGLRRSKLSYHPQSLQHKYTAIHLHSHEAECKSLWHRVFTEDTDSEIDHFLHRHFSTQGMLSIADPSLHYISMLHIIPMSSEVGRVAYIYGVATHPLHRGKGYASKLMSEAMRKIRAEGYVAVALIPAEEWLKGYYAKFGFNTTSLLHLHSQDSFDFGSGTGNPEEGMIAKIAEVDIGEELLLHQIDINTI